VTEEELFEQWFQQQRRKTWEASRAEWECKEPSAAWSMGMRCLYWEGWMARAALPQTAGATDKSEATFTEREQAGKPNAGQSEAIQPESDKRKKQPTGYSE
jgi:hypothetical protein